MHQIRFCGAPDPAWGAHSAPQTPSCIQAVLLLREGRLKGEGGREREGVEEMGRGGRGKGRVASWLLGDRRPCKVIDANGKPIM